MRTLRRAGIFGFSALLLLMCFWLTGCQLSGTFSVSKMPGGAGLGMEYERLNGRKTAELGLSEGDRVRVSLLHTAGQVDVVLCREGDDHSQEWNLSGHCNGSSGDGEGPFHSARGGIGRQMKSSLCGGVHLPLRTGQDMHPVHHGIRQISQFGRL